MRTIFLTFTILFLASTVSVCQKKYIDVIPAEEKDENSQIYLTYYFKELSIEPSIFLNDSIILSNNKIDLNSPKIELYENYEFCFFYDITSEKQKKISFDTEERILQTNKTSHIMIGNYQITQVNYKNEKGSMARKKLTLNFENGNAINYYILELGKEIILKKE